MANRPASTTKATDQANRWRQPIKSTDENSRSSQSIKTNDEGLMKYQRNVLISSPVSTHQQGLFDNETRCLWRSGLMFIRVACLGQLKTPTSRLFRAVSLNETWEVFWPVPVRLRGLRKFDGNINPWIPRKQRSWRLITKALLCSCTLCMHAHAHIPDHCALLLYLNVRPQVILYILPTMAHTSKSTLLPAKTVNVITRQTPSAPPVHYTKYTDLLAHNGM
jgi:hypothetical protein